MQLISIVLGVAVSGALAVDPVRDDYYECAWRVAAYKFAPYIQPWLETDGKQLRMLFDALQLKGICNESFVAPESPVRTRPRSTPKTDPPCAVYVSPNGADSGSRGTQTDPYATIEAAVAASRECSSNATVTLLNGTHYLNQTLVLGPADSGLRIVAGPDARAVVSGGYPLRNLDWKPYKGGIFVADLAEVPPQGIRALLVNGKRATRARYPNANPETDLFPVGYITEPTSWGRPKYQGVPCDMADFCGTSSTELTPVTDGWRGIFQNYTMGKGGACDRYDPPESPWCSDAFYAQRQLPEMHARSPSGVFAEPLLPNFSKYSDVIGAEIHTWRLGHWYSWMFQVNGSVPGSNSDAWTVLDGQSNVEGQLPSPRGYADLVKYLGDFNTSSECWAAANATNSTGSDFTCLSWTWYEPDVPDWGAQCYCHVDFWWKPAARKGATSGLPPGRLPVQLTFGAGGNQGAEGADQAAEWWIDNVFEELDAPNEFYFDQGKSRLYYYLNASDGQTAPPSEVVVPTLATLIELRGNATDPVRGVAIEGIEFTATRPTYLEPMGIPSGGDWALQRVGALLLEGTEDVTVSGNAFRRLDANAVMVSGYNRRTHIARNEFSSLGMNGAALWGRTDGIDGRAGEQPRGVVFEANFCYRVGIWQKQSSCYFQALSAQNTIADNIMFNLPRAAINFNDGFGGGHEMRNNLMFNTCRESSDHGAFNAWDRLPYVTTVRDGSPSTRPAVNDMHHNFIVANYHADGGCFDTDDGAAYYMLRQNFCVYGGHKVDFDGHSKTSYANIHVYPMAYFQACLAASCQNLPPKGYGETYDSNTCILPSQGTVYIRLDDTDLKDAATIRDGLAVSNNTLYAPGGADGAVVLGSGGANITVASWLALGYESGLKVVDGKPDPSTLIDWAKTLLMSGGNQSD